MSVNVILQLPNDKIVRIVEQLGNAKMKPSSHGYEKYPGFKIIDAAIAQSREFLEKSEQDKNAAVTLMDVVLAANRNYNRQVEPHVRRMRTKYPDLTFKGLHNLLASQDYVGFKNVWGHRDEKKYNTLKALVDAIIVMKKANPELSDWEIMRRWAEDASVERKCSDCLGRIPNIGIATFQHLRIVFGIDTVKPDQRVQEVLAREFFWESNSRPTLSPEEAIRAVEEIARITGHKVNEIDQIFVKYGSGYYEKQGANKLKN